MGSSIIAVKTAMRRAHIWNAATLLSDCNQSKAVSTFSFPDLAIAEVKLSVIGILG